MRGCHFGMNAKCEFHYHYCAFCGERFAEAATFDPTCGHRVDHAFGWCGKCDKTKFQGSDGSQRYALAAEMPETKWHQHLCSSCGKTYGCLWCSAFGPEDVPDEEELDIWCGCD